MTFIIQGFFLKYLVYLIDLVAKQAGDGRISEV
jgi:hypothetical protein